MDADVLCAVKILSIFELLDHGRDNARTKHAAGAATLIRHRGPNRYKTNFEKALVLSQADPIIQEGLLNLSPCFLQEFAWQHLLRTISLGEFHGSYSSDAYVKAWACITAVLGLIYSIRASLHGPTKDSGTGRERLLRHIRDLRSPYINLKTEQCSTQVVSSGSAKSIRLLLQ